MYIYIYIYIHMYIMQDLRVLVLDPQRAAAGRSLRREGLPTQRPV